MSLIKKIKFSKPKVKIKPIGTKKLISQFAKEQGALVKEVPEREYSDDDRSLFFKEEFKKQKEKNRGWL